MAGFALLAALAFTLLLGFALLALSQDRHRRAVGGPARLPPAATGALRVLGGSLLILGLIIAALRDGNGFGPLLWTCLLSLAAFAVTAAVSFWPAPLRALAAVIGAAVGILCGRSGEKVKPEGRSPGS